MPFDYVCVSVCVNEFAVEFTFGHHLRNSYAFLSFLFIHTLYPIDTESILLKASISSTFFVLFFFSLCACVILFLGECVIAIFHSAFTPLTQSTPN